MTKFPFARSRLPDSECSAGYSMILQFCGVVVTQPLPGIPFGLADVPVPEKNVGSPPETERAPV